MKNDVVWLLNYLNTKQLDYYNLESVYQYI